MKTLQGGKEENGTVPGGGSEVQLGVLLFLAKAVCWKELLWQSRESLSDRAWEPASTPQRFFTEMEKQDGNNR